MKLTIVIPAFNEQDAIGSIIERCVAAREVIVANSPVTTVEIIVVSDGSTDRTVQIARKHRDTRLIVFPHNRGYGAAIKAGFEAGRSELVGFLDADGTCDPDFFADLCRALVERDASVALGSRMGPDSQMPKVRRLGNRVYALLLSLLSNRVVTDAASGMRVIRRAALPGLYPLPDGLHFTPAMSARVLMDDRMKIVELPMSYRERVGESKLHVLRDGVRFLRTILEMTLMWRPARVFVAAGAVCVTLMTLLAMHPIESWLRRGGFAEDSIYRLLACSLLGTIGITLVSAGVICRSLQRLLDDQRPETFAAAVLDRLYSGRGLVGVSIIAAPLLAYLVGPGVWTRITDGYVGVHWSRVVLGGLVLYGVVQMAVATLTVNVIRFHTERRRVIASSDLERRDVTCDGPASASAHRHAVAH